MTLEGRQWRRLLLVADSHGQLAPPIVEAAHDVDCVVHAGDVGNGAVLACLRASATTIAVRGNNDRPEAWPAGDREILAALPGAVRLALAGGELVIIHGHQYPQANGRHDALRRDYAGVRGIVYGHSHRLTIDDRLAPWVFNPGACGRARVGAGASGLLLHVTTRGWRIEVVGPFERCPARPKRGA